MEWAFRPSPRLGGAPSLPALGRGALPSLHIPGDAKLRFLYAPAAISREALGCRL